MFFTGQNPRQMAMCPFTNFFCPCMETCPQNGYGMGYCFMRSTIKCCPVWVVNLCARSRTVVDPWRVGRSVTSSIFDPIKSNFSNRRIFRKKCECECDMTFKRFEKLYIWIYQFRLLAEEEKELWQFSMTRKMAYLVFTNRSHFSLHIILFMIMYDELIDWVFTVTGNVYLLIYFGDHEYRQVPTIIRGCD